MASSPAFTNVPVVGAAAVSATIETSYTAPAQSVTVFKATGARVVTDGVTTNASTTVTSATAAFGAGDLGRPISGSGIPTGSVIVAFSSATSITISAPATASASGVTLTLGGGQGAKLEEIVVEGLGTTVAGVLVYSIYDGSTYHSFDSTVITVVTPSTSTAPFRASQRYANLFLPATWSLVVSSWVANQLAKVTAIGGAF
jgi:hypothetical protein